jgi:hypothetical protein
MAAPACSDEEFMALFAQHGAMGTAKILGVAERNVYARRRRLESAHDKTIASPNSGWNHESLYPKRVPLDVTDGVVLIGSDAHYWPDVISAAHRGLVRLSGELKPKAVILNGDAFDGARISRHPRIGWARTPTVKEEQQAVDARTDEIRAAAKGAKLIWTIGNHDARFENRLADKASEFEGLQGFTLKDNFPHWQLCMSTWINDEVVVKHRFKGGVHATHNNTVSAGKTMVTGHLHSLKVTPYDDYNGTRFGVDTGTLADPYGPQFEYAEDNPLNHRSGFVVLTFHKGRLMWPEIVRVLDDKHIEFRGQVIAV